MFLNGGDALSGLGDAEGEHGEVVGWVKGRFSDPFDGANIARNFEKTK